VDPGSIIAEPVVQYGFAGLAVVQLAVIVWLIRNLMRLLDRTNGIITENTSAIRELSKSTSEELRLIREMRDKLLVLDAREQSDA